MRELRGDIWNRYDDGQWIVLTTNGTVRNDGAAVMGRGIALQAAQRMPDLPFRLGDRIHVQGNRTHAFTQLRLFTLPVKIRWQDPASPTLIRQSVVELVKLVDLAHLTDVYMVRPGCGNGGLEWRVVKPLIADVLDERFAIVEKYDQDPLAQSERAK